MSKYSFFLAMLLVLPLTTAKAGELDHAAFRSANVQEYLVNCPHFPPNKGIMESQIRQILRERRRNTSMLEYLALRWKYPINWSGQISKVTLDHYELKNIHAVDLEILIKFTFYDSYKTKTTYQKDATGNFAIIRSCPGDSCYGFNNFDLKSIAQKPNDNCSDALCAFKSIFGEESGVEYLWDHLVNGSSLSPFTQSQLDLVGFSNENRTAILTAYNLVPQHLKKSAIASQEFFRMRGRNPFGQFANAMGMVFDSIDNLTIPEMIYVFYHELGHRMRGRDGKKLDESAVWLNLTGWTKTGMGFFDWSNSSGGPFASEHARKNPWEDFAESFALYRFDSQKLKSISPNRYFFLRDNIYNGIEYDSVRCSAQN